MQADLRVIQWQQYNETLLSPLSVVILMAMLSWILWGKSRYALIPTLVIAAFVPSDHRIVLFSLDFSLIRIMLIGGFLRILLRNDERPLQFNRLDGMMILYVLSGFVAYVALHGTMSAVINRVGMAYETLLVYFFVRYYLRSRDKLTVLVRAFAYICIFVALLMAIEKVTRFNVFSVLGGVREIPNIREGRMRAQGAFSHAILAGTFGAAFLPLFWGLRKSWNGVDRTHAAAGVVSALVITMASSSSGPIMTLMAAVFALMMWNWRRYTATIRTGAVLLLIGLHIIMEQPVWHLVSRIDLVGGSTGYHRYKLIDQAINRFSEWAFIGVRTTGHWGWGLNDVTNMYVLQAVRGGVFHLLFFVMMIHCGFKYIHAAVAFSGDDESAARLYWAWGAVLFAHCISFIGVSYFGQMFYFWIFTLGVVGSLPEIACDVGPGDPIKCRTRVLQR